MLAMAGTVQLRRANKVACCARALMGMAALFAHLGFRGKEVVLVSLKLICQDLLLSCRYALRLVSQVPFVLLTSAMGVAARLGPGRVAGRVAWEGSLGGLDLTRGH